MPTSSSTPSGNTGRNRPPGETSEARIAKALAHPCARDPAAARRTSRESRRSCGGARCSARGRQLPRTDVARLRLVELVRTEPRRGALQHFYRATARPILDDDQWRTPAVRPAHGAGRRDDQGSRRPTSALPPTPASWRTRSDHQPHAARARRAAFKKLNKLLADARAGPGHRGGERGPRHRAGVFPTELAVLHFKRAGPKLKRGGPRRTAGPPRRSVLARLDGVARSCCAPDLDDDLGALLQALGRPQVIFTLALPDLVMTSWSPAGARPVSLALRAVGGARDRAGDGLARARQLAGRLAVTRAGGRARRAGGAGAPRPRRGGRGRVPAPRGTISGSDVASPVPAALLADMRHVSHGRCRRWSARRSPRRAGDRRAVAQPLPTANVFGCCGTRR